MVGVCFQPSLVGEGTAGNPFDFFLFFLVDKGLQHRKAVAKYALWRLERRGGGFSLLSQDLTMPTWVDGRWTRVYFPEGVVALRWVPGVFLVLGPGGGFLFLDCCVHQRTRHSMHLERALLGGLVVFRKAWFVCVYRDGRVDAMHTYRHRIMSKA